MARKAWGQDDRSIGPRIWAALQGLGLKEHVELQPIGDGTWDVVRSEDGGYVGHRTGLGSPGYLRWLLHHGIRPELAAPEDRACSVGRGRDGRWYGWSHRAAGSFGIGDRVTPGHVAYVPSNSADFLLQCVKFWSSDTHLNIRGEGGSHEGRAGVWVHWTYSDSVLNESIRGNPGRVFNEHPDQWGRGTWTATTDEDARQMACDFASGVS